MLSKVRTTTLLLYTNIKCCMINKKLIAITNNLCATLL